LAIYLVLRDKKRGAFLYYFRVSVLYKVNIHNANNKQNCRIHMTNNQNDIFFMRRAIEVSRTGQGKIAGIRPSVGCVLVNPYTQEIISYGRTADNGRPHAETAAIMRAITEGKQGQLAGATAYVTLEPCAHLQKGKPICCAQSIVDHGIKRVVVACDDPFDKVNGAGYAILEQAGINVVRNVLTNEAQSVLQDFLTVVQYGRPFVTLKMAVSADGVVGVKGQEQARITGDIAQKHAHLALRQFRKAIMVGIGTALEDDPTLTIRIDGVAATTTRIVIDPRLELPAHSKLIQSAEGGHPLLVVHNKSADIPLDLQNVNNLQLVAVDNTHDLIQVLGTLATDSYGITSLLVEGGAQLIQSFIEAKLWDEFYLYKSPIERGAKDAICAPSLGENHLVNTERLGADSLEIYHPIAPPRMNR
jgi:diaminohydroxyphosphoribosylaminopyrimidine deaminase/5-amino-6-(5-phosphoribosylamino)uracil reductase